MDNPSLFFPRDLLLNIEKYLDRPEIIAIKGPRQAGKTTLLKQIKEILIAKLIPDKNIVYLTFEDKEILEKFVLDHKNFIKSFIQPSASKFFFLLDEYQYVPDGGQKLKLLYDIFPQTKFIISGSSSLELVNQTARYLVGRVFSFYLYPLSFREYINVKTPNLLSTLTEKQRLLRDFLFKGKGVNLKILSSPFIKDFKKLFEEYVTFGGYPEVVKTTDLEIKKEVIKNIINTYLEKDIVGLLQIGDFLKFKSLAVMLAAQIGNLINYQQLTNDSGIHFNRLKNYLSNLEETYIIKILPPYYKNLTTELKKNPKIYFFDSGLRNYLVGNFSPLDNRSDKGQLVEMAGLTNLLFSFTDNLNYRFWRTTGGAELDFVLKQGEIIYPIEVKYSSFKRPQISRSFLSFINTYRPKTALILTKDFIGSVTIKQTLVYFAPIYYF
ncbi:MAG: ATP-binding protein [Patescibacteria group bacterium]